MSSTVNLANATGVGPFDITTLGLIPNNRVPFSQQLRVKQNDSTISASAYTVDAGLGTITFSSDISGLSTFIERDTPRDLAVTFTDAARLPAADINDAFTQTINLIDEVIADPVSALQLGDLSDVGEFGDSPVDNDILVYDNGVWKFEDRGAVNAVTATNVSVAFNSSNAEDTLLLHNSSIATIADQAQDISHSGNVTQLGQDGRVLGDLDVVGTLTFGSLGSSIETLGTYTGAGFVANTVNGATGFTLANTGTGLNDTFTMDMAGDELAFRCQGTNGFEWYRDGSNILAALTTGGAFRAYDQGNILNYVYMSPNNATSNAHFGVYQGGSSVFYATGDGRAFATANTSSPTSSQLLNRSMGDNRYNRQVSNDTRNQTLAQWIDANSSDSQNARDIIPNNYFLPSKFSNIDANNGMFCKQDHATVDNSLVSTAKYQFEYWVGYKTSSAEGRLMTRMGTTTGSDLASKMSTDSQGYAYQEPSVNGWLINSRHFISGWYRRVNI